MQEEQLEKLGEKEDEEAELAANLTNLGSDLGEGEASMFHVMPFPWLW